jgi:hypothetical protein
MPNRRRPEVFIRLKRAAAPEQPIPRNSPLPKPAMVAGTEHSAASKKACFLDATEVSQYLNLPLRMRARACRAPVQIAS